MLAAKLFKNKCVFTFTLLVLSLILKTQAQEVPFSPRLNEAGNSYISIKGDYTMLSNSVMNRRNSRSRSPSNVNTPYNGVNSNNNFHVEYIDIDGDPTTFSSSSSTLSLPSCSRIYYAGLYWAGNYDRDVRNSRYTNTSRPDPLPNDNNRYDFTSVKLKLPGGAYMDLQADTAPDPVGQEDEIIIDGLNTVSNSPYVCYKNVTAELQALADPTGEYTVANVRGTRGRTSYGVAGWSLVIIYENPTMPGRYISTFDGYEGVTTRNTADRITDIPIAGFNTVPVGPVNAKIGAGVLEGEANLGGDRFQIRSEINRLNGQGFTDLFNAANPVSNFFNSNITIDGANVTTRDLNGTNSMGYDSDIFDINNPSESVIPNGETAATLRLTTSSDWFGAFLVTFGVDIIEPDIVLEKKVNDLAGNDITGAGVNLGDDLVYVLSFENVGNDDGTNYTIRDILPINTSPQSGPGTNFSPSDFVLPPGVTYTYDSVTRTIVFTIPDNLIEENDPQASIRFRVKVAENCFDFVDACSDLIENVAYSTYQGEDNPNVITDDPSVRDFNSCGFVTPGASNFLLDDLTACDFTRTVQLCGDNILLDAGDNFDSYIWYRDENGDQLIDSGDTIITDGDSDNDPSTFLVDQEGIYIVDKIIPAPCIGFQEILIVERFGVNTVNPITEFFNNSNSDADVTNDIEGEITTCSVDGDLLTKIFLCGSGDDQILQTNITDAQTISWEILDEASCSAEPDDCANKNATCSWSQVATGSTYTANAAGKYRIVVTYQNGCFNRFYFDVFQNILDVQYDSEDIICTTDGYINVTNVGGDYGFQLLDITNNTIEVPFSSSNGPNFTITNNGVYQVQIAQLDTNGNPITNGCIFSTPEIGILNRDFQVDITTAPANCNAQGSIQIDVLNVEADYTYRLLRPDNTLIDDETAQPDNTHTFNVIAGDYIVEVSTDDGCTFSENVTIQRTPDPTLTAVKTSDIGCSAGAVTLTENGGLAGYSYAIWSWSGDASPRYTDISDIPGSAYQGNTFVFGWRDTDFDPVTPDIYSSGDDGTYVFVVVDANNCFALSNPITIIDNGAMTVSVTDDSEVSCNNNADASITIVPSGGIGPFTYSIDGGTTTQTSASFVGLSAATYSIQVTDSSGCLVDLNHTIDNPTPLVSEAVQTQDYTCLQLGQISVGSVTATTGGSGNYQYSIDGSTWTATTTDGHVFTDLSNGTYTVRVRDANSTTCSITLADIVIGALPIAPTPSTSVTYDCDGNGIITVLSSDPNYFYSLDAGTAQASNVFSNVSVGNHTITIDYGLDCTIDTTVIINSGNAFSATFVNSTNPSCNGLTDGTITFEVNNYNTPVGFEYSVDGGTNYITSTTSPVTTGAIYGDGSQTILVRKADETTCTTPVTTTITEPTAVIADALITTQITCTNGGATITASALGGLPTYQYQLEDNSGGVITPFQTSTIFTNVAAGTYIVVARDNNSCEDSIDATLVVAPTNPVDFDLDASICYSGANDATIEVDVTDGNGNYTFSINGGPWVAPTPATATTYTFENLSSGIYSINVRDGSGCEGTAQDAEIEPEITVSATAPPITACATSTFITITTTGGDGSFQFAVMPDGDTPSMPDYDASRVREVFAAGDYDIYLRDPSGGPNRCSAFTEITITQDDPIVITSTSDPVSCFGNTDGSIDIVVNSGGEGPFEFSIDGGSTYEIGGSFVNLSAATYSVLVRDANNCETTPVDVVVGGPPELIAEAVLTQDYTCLQLGQITIGSVTPTTGGSGDFQYSINGSTWTPSTPLGHTYIDLLDGTYSIRVRDAGATSCVVTLADIVITPLPVEPTIGSSIAYNCDGTADITITPFDATYTYILDGVLPGQTGVGANIIADVALGNHTVTVDYGRDCTVDIAVIVAPGNAFEASITAFENLDCFADNSGTITITADNFNAGGFEYSLNGAAFEGPFTTDEQITGLAAQAHNIIVRDVDDPIAGCTITLNQTLTEPTALVASAAITETFTCNNTGATITASAIGGTPTYEYQLEDGVGGIITAYQSAVTFTSLAAGDYIVRARDINSCNDPIDTPITVVAPVNPTFTITENTCYSGANDATIQVDVTSVPGNGGFLFSINGDPFVTPTPASATSYTFDNLANGTYTIDVRDGFGCSAVQQNITIEPELTLTASAPNIPTCGTTTDITINASGGDQNYIYAVIPSANTINDSDFNTTNPVSVSATGNYNVYVRDQNGGALYCQDVFAITINQDLPLALNVTNTPVGCSGDATATLTVGTTGGSTPYQYSINDGTSFQSTDTFLNLAAGSYNVLVRDANNCEAREIYVISEPSNLSASAGVTEVVECNPSNGAEVRITNAIGGTLPYEYSFDGGANFQASNIGFLPPGTHDLLIRDASLCTFPMSVTVADALPEPDFTSVIDYECDGEATITVNSSIPTGFDYDYEINSVPNTPPNSNVFNDVPAGTHTVTINYVANPPPVAGDLLFDSFGSGVNRPTPEIDPVYCYEPQNGAPTCPGFLTTAIEDGEYSVTNLISNPYPTWLSPNDHTNPSDPNGRFLAINVGGVAGVNGIIYAKRNVEVLPNRIITISLETFNLLRQGESGADPTIVVQLVNGGGTVIASTASGNIPKNTGADDWHNFTVDLNPGAETNLDIVIRTNSAVVLGNDIAIDDIQAFQTPLVCPQSKDIIVVVEPGNELRAAVTGNNAISCNGLSDGTVTFEVENFDTVNGFQYSVNGSTFSVPQMSSPIEVTNLPPGATNIVIRDFNDNSCAVNISQNIIEPALIIANASVTTPFTCNTAGAVITAGATGGSPSYEYQLENTLGAVITAYQSSEIFNNVPAGDFNIRARDVNGCDDLIDTPITIATPSNPTFTTSPTDCYSGNNDGTIFVDVTSLPGNGGFQFSIDAGPWISPTIVTDTNYTFDNLSPGSYAINVKDQFGCIGISQNVTINSQLVVSTVLNDDLTCLTPATITLTTSGGSGTYNYEWSNDAGVTYASTNFVGNVFSTNTDGNYIFRVTDTTTPAPCSFTTAPVSVTPAVQPVITSVTPTAILCNGDSSGVLDVVIDTSVGTPPYTIEVVETNSTTNYGAQTTGLPAGNYEVRITDGKGCVSNPVSAVISEPNAITYDINLIPITCNTTTGTDPGSITVENLMGGTAEYTYYLTGNNGFSATYATTSGGENHTFAILEFGIYEVDVVDTNGCSVRTTNIIASPPDDLDIDVTATTTSCATGGTAVVSVSTAILGTDYMFGILDTYASPYASTYFPPDVPMGPTYTFTGLVPGITYTFVVHDRTTDCYYFETAAAPINSPSNMTATLDVVSNISCTGAIDGNVSFTFDNYDPSTEQVSYEIFNSQSNITTGITGSSPVNPPTGSISVPNFGALAEGIYYILLTEESPIGGGVLNGCSIATPDFTIDAASVLLSISATSPTNDNCSLNAGVIVATAQFGQAPYQFQYLPSTDPAPIVSTPGWTNATSANVESGDYIVYAMDNHGCIQSDTVTVLLDPDPEISVIVVDNCMAEGTYQALVTLDTPSSTPYALSINGGAFQNITFNGSNQYTVGGLSSGTGQTIEIQDLNGCGEIENFDIYPRIQFTAVLTKNLTCDPPPADNAEITIEVTAGSGSYDIEITNDGGVTPLARIPFPSNPYVYMPTDPANYNVIIYDNNTADACRREFVVNVPPATDPIVFETHTDVTCFGAADGTIAMSYTDNGINPLTYSISPSAGTFNAATTTFENLPADTYTVTATGVNNCEAILTDIVIGIPDEILITNPTVVQFGCTTGNSMNFATITVDASNIVGGSGTYTIYEFINDQGTLAPGDDVSEQTGPSNTYTERNTAGGSYIIKVSDDAGCEGIIDNIDIDPFDALSSGDIVVDNPISCTNAGEDITITAIGSLTNSNTHPTNYEFRQLPSGVFQPSGVFTDLAVGTHVFEMRNTRTLCVTTRTHIVSAPNTFDLVLNKIQDIICFGTETGQVTLELVDPTYVGPFNWTIYNDNGTAVDRSDDTVYKSGTSATNGPTPIITLIAGGFIAEMSQVNFPECTNTEAFTIAGPSAAITANVDVTPITCVGNDGVIQIIDAIGGWGGYQYYVGTVAPTGAGDYVASPRFDSLAPGTYQAWVMDQNGCQEEVQSPIVLADPTPITASLAFQPNCPNFAGEIQVTGVSGGQNIPANYSYQLQVLNTTSSLFEDLRPIQNSDTFSGLGAGEYQVVITDQWSCTFTTATQVLYEPIVPLATVVKTIDCTPDPGGHVTITQTGGSGNFTYAVEFPDNTTPLPTNTTGIFTTLTLPGDYVFTITDQDAAHACPVTITQNLQERVLPVLTINDATHVTCNNFDDGTISVSVTDNGVGPYVFTIISGPGSTTTFPITATSNTATSAVFEGLQGSISGITYTIEARGANNCFVTETQTITQPEPITGFSVTPTPFLCTTGNNPNFAVLTVDPGLTGGSNNYVKYIFTNTDTGLIVQNDSDPTYIERNRAGGNYSIQVLDDMGCEATTTASIAPFVEISDPTVTITNNITCNPGNDAEIIIGTVVNPSAGTVNLEYTVVGTDNAYSVLNQTSNAFTNLGIGNYNVTVTNTLTGCSVQTTFEIEDPNTFEIATTIVDVVCFADNGTVSFTVSDAINPYVGGFSWQIYESQGTDGLLDDVIVTGASGVSANLGPTTPFAIAAGEYRVEITQDSDPSCVNNERFVIAGPSAAITANVDVTPITCVGNDGVIQIIDAIGGWGGYQYYVGTVAPTGAGDYVASPRFDSLAPGTYQAWVMDQNGCQEEVQSPIVLADPTPITASLAFQPNCPNFAGEIQVTGVSGGQNIPANYSYQLQVLNTTSSLFEDLRPIQNSDTFSGLGAGEYQVVITDQWSCTFTTATQVLYEPIVPLATVVKTIDCTPDPGGHVTITQTGGSGNFTYAVEFPDNTTPLPTNTTGIFTTLTLPGDYVFTITDQDAAHACPVTITQNLQERVLPVLTINDATHVTCNNFDDGTISVSVTDNGVGPYVFTIISGPGSTTTFPITATSNTATSAVFEGLQGSISGITYTIEARGANNCFVTETQTITQPEPITGFSVTPTPFLCTTGNNPNFAVLTVDPGLTGGSNNYVKYIFTNTDTGLIVQNDSDPTYIERNRAGGNYSIQVLDDMGCEATTTTSIAPFVEISNPTVTITNNITCNPAILEDIQVTVTVNPTSATPNLEYTATGTNIVFSETNSTGLFTGLDIGNYVISITNIDTGCAVQTTHEILDPDVIEVVADKLTDEECLNNMVDEGSFAITINNYIGNYSFQLYDDNNNPIVGAAYSGNGNTSTPLIFSNLPGGVYYVRIIETDAPYCQDDSNNITILAPEFPITLAINEQNNPSCTDDQGSILVDPEGGVGPYNIVLTNTTTSQVYTESNVEAFIFSGLSGGDFTIEVTDAQACPESGTISLLTPNGYTPTISRTPLDCFNGNNATVFTTVPSGRNVSATAVYEYQLNTYDSTGTNLLITSALQGSLTFTDLSAGFYSITVTDNFGCTYTSAIEEIINPTEVIAQLIRTRALTCDPVLGVEFELSATGGSGSYEYSVDNTNWFTMPGSSTPIPNANIPGPLTAGTYRYYVRDAVGCPSVLSNEITEDIIMPLTFSDVNATAISCVNDTAMITADATGGLGNYMYELFTDVSLSAASRIAGPQSSGIFNSLGAGNYYVNVTSSDCITNAVQVEIEAPIPLDFTESFEDARCFGDENGSITLTLSGGSGGYQYAISPNLNQYTAENTFDGLAAGNYTVIAQDSNGCFIQRDYTISAPDLMVVTGVATPEECVGDEDGTITLDIQFGTPPYSTRLSSEPNFIPNRTELTDLAAGGYIIFVQDANGCLTDIGMTVEAGANINATIEPVYECTGIKPDNYVNITLEDQTVIGDVLYGLDNGPLQLTPDFRNISPGSHYISIAHSSGCIETFDFEIENFEPLTLTLEQSGINRITATADGGLENYTFYFGDKNNGADNTFIISATDTYTVRVVDENGCEATADIFMEFIDIELPEFFTPDGDGLNDTWMPLNQEGFPEILTIIFDRYGRELYRITLNSPPWDGLYNKSELPTGDYWYVIKLRGENDDREFVGHFTLYR